jgi:hypothetical protein
VKKFIASVLAIALVCSLSFSLVGCGSKNTSKTTKSTESTGTGTAK